MRTFLLISLLMGSSAMLWRCSHLVPKKFLPQEFEYELILDPVFSASNNKFTIDSTNGSFVYLDGDIKLIFEQKSDRELNKRFASNSDKGKNSTNPFTYGNWVDIGLGYSPPRFTVFGISLYNYALPKMQFDPQKTRLILNTGEKFYPYSEFRSVESYQSFEEYYTHLRGFSGNELKRYQERMGIINSQLLSNKEILFKGDDRTGHIAFDPLPENVKDVTLKIQDIYVAYDKYDRPEKILNLELKFVKRIVKKEKMGSPEKKEPAKKVSLKLK